MLFIIMVCLIVGATCINFPIKHEYTSKPRFNKSEGTKDFVLYIRDFFIAGTFYYKIRYGGT
jgi:hypothetical protein